MYWLAIGWQALQSWWKCFWSILHSCRCQVCCCGDAIICRRHSLQWPQETCLKGLVIAQAVIRWHDHLRSVRHPRRSWLHYEIVFWCTLVTRYLDVALELRHLWNPPLVRGLVRFVLWSLSKGHLLVAYEALLLRWRKWVMLLCSTWQRSRL